MFVEVQSNYSENSEFFLNVLCTSKFSEDYVRKGWFLESSCFSETGS